MSTALKCAATKAVRGSAVNKTLPGEGEDRSRTELGSAGKSVFYYPPLPAETVQQIWRQHTPGVSLLPTLRNALGAEWYPLLDCAIGCVAMFDELTRPPSREPKALGIELRGQLDSEDTAHLIASREEERVTT